MLSSPPNNLIVSVSSHTQHPTPKVRLYFRVWYLGYLDAIIAVE